jgi:hypothetical protein
LAVSEPWNYNGNIIGTVLDVNEKRIIFKSDYQINIQGVSGNIFMLRSRYGENCKELPLNVNVAIILSNYDSTKTDEQLLKNSKFVIIGSLEKYNYEHLLESLKISNIGSKKHSLGHYLALSFIYFMLFVFVIKLFEPIFNILHLFIK